MRKPIAIVLGMILLCFSVRFVSAQSLQSYEHIEQFDSTVTVQKDASIDVSETIVYTFPSNEERHGIYRTIPVNNIHISDISVTDENGYPYSFTTSHSVSSETIKIGNANLLVTGTHTYVLAYKVQGAMDYGKNEDELYWNATGTEWDYPMLVTHQTVILPTELSQDSLHTFCYKGPAGSTSACDGTTTVTTSEGQTHVQFAQISQLAPHAGVTIAVGFPKGVVVEPTAFQKFMMAVRDNLALLITLILSIGVIAYVAIRWWKYGRDAKGTGIIVPQYDVPDQLHPAEMAALVATRIRNGDISAEIIALAVNGYLRIEKIEGTGFIVKGDDYRLTLLKAFDEHTTELDRIILTGLCGGDAATDDTVRLSDLKGTFYATVKKFKERTFSSVVSREYFYKDPSKSRSTAVFIAMFGLFVAVFVGISAVTAFSSPYIILLLIVDVIVIALFTYLMPARTEKGVRTKEYVLGLKDYLQIAEKDRIAFHNAPEKKPELFEAFLPYAMVLGVEKAWAKEFEDIYVTPPTWYVDPTMRGFNTGLFINSFSSFNSATASSFTPPSSGGSASGGGGFSGGGAGGGGGGSW